MQGIYSFKNLYVFTGVHYIYFILLLHSSLIDINLLRAHANKHSGRGKRNTSTPAAAESCYLEGSFNQHHLHFQELSRPMMMTMTNG